MTSLNSLFLGLALVTTACAVDPSSDSTDDPGGKADGSFAKPIVTDGVVTGPSVPGCAVDAAWTKFAARALSPLTGEHVADLRVSGTRERLHVGIVVQDDESLDWGDTLTVWLDANGDQRFDERDLAARIEIGQGRPATDEGCMGEVNHLALYKFVDGIWTFATPSAKGTTNAKTSWHYHPTASQPVWQRWELELALDLADLGIHATSTIGIGAKLVVDQPGAAAAAVQIYPETLPANELPHDTSPNGNDVSADQLARITLR